MNWINIAERLPNIPIGHNAVLCEVKNESGLTDIAIYGTSGFMGEPIGFYAPSSKKFTANEIAQYQIIHNDHH